ncbi:hypothetical protein PybrP1_002790 [[Pythium] brassicae (nom. inval.)]|nr:hypothetical protein PybrP1_002790 [[Pythium] brassicae (nom. inval.)]
MRAQRSGVIANLGSIGGWRALPLIGWYTATKFAVAGITTSLRAEVAPLGIDVTCVDLGSFRTSLLYGNMAVAERKIADLAPCVEPTRQFLAARGGKQPSDPRKAAQLLVEALTKTGRCADRALPARLALGKDSIGAARAVMETAEQELAAWADLASTTDFDE